MSDKLRGIVECLRSLAAKQAHGGTRDSELLRSFVETRSSDAFAGIMRRHGAMVLGLARRIVGDRQLAEDVFQATFLVLGRKAHSVRARESLPAWLHRVALRLAIRAKKSRQRLSDYDACATTAAPSDPLDEISVREMLAILDEELTRLPEKYRLPLILCHLEGLSQHEASRRLDVSPGSIKGMLERGRLLLRKRLIARGLDASAALAGALELGSTAQAVSPGLIRATLGAALTSQRASATAVALAEGAIMTMTAAKITTVCLAVVLLGAVGAGAGWMVLGAGSNGKGGLAVGLKPALEAQAAPPRGEKAQAVDCYGDLLPEGAALRLGTVQLRAAGASLALNTDAKTLIGVRRGKIISFWDAQFGKLQATREFPINRSRGSVLSSDGRLLATDDLEVWDVETGKLSRKLRLDKGPLSLEGRRQAFSRDSAYIAYVGTDSEERNDKPDTRGRCLAGVWDLRTGRQLFAKNLPYVRFYSPPDEVGFTPTGNRLLVSCGGTLYCWDIDGGKELWRCEQFLNTGALFAFSPDGATLVSGSPPVDLTTGRQVQLPNLPPRELRYATHQMLVVPDGRTLLLSRPEGVLVWDLTSGKAVRSLAGTGDMVLSPDGKTLITNDGVLQRWDLATGKALFVDNFDKGHSREVVALVFSADGKRLASCADDGSVRLWDTTSARPVRFWRGHPPSGLNRLLIGANARGANALGMTPDGRWVASCGDGNIKIWDAVSGKESRSIELPPPGPSEAGQTGLHLHFCAKGKKLVGTFGAMAVAPPSPGQTLEHNHWLATWDLQSGTMLTKAPFTTSNAVSSGFSRDGRWLLTWGTLIDTATGKERARLEGADMSLTPSAISADGSLIASGGNSTRRAGNSSANVVIHEAATGKEIAVFKTPSPYAQLAFHPSNRFIAIADASGIEIWDIAAAKQVAELKLPGEIPGNLAQDACASCMVFAPDGRRLATGHLDGMIFIWNVDVPRAQRRQPVPEEIELLWTDLKDADPARAWRAVWRLADAPDEALALLRKKLKRFSGASPAITRPLLADLAGDVFARREAAGKELKALGIFAEPAPRERLKNDPPLELRLRIEALLKALAETPPPLTAEVLRDLRAVAVLARIESPQAANSSTSWRRELIPRHLRARRKPRLDRLIDVISQTAEIRPP
jgi:RNA polymerase sigma factor (sigma-70 family)